MKPSSITISDYDPAWPRMFAEERGRILEALGAAGDSVVALEHVGSTAVPGLAANPLIDIMIGMRTIADGVRCITPMVELGYECVGEYGVPARIYFRKGMPRSHHVHLVEHGSRFWKRHIAFRDLLRSRADLAEAYGALKRRLAAELDKADYTFAKSSFIEAAMAYRAAIIEGEAIVIVDYDDEWPALFAREKARIEAALSGTASVIGIEHVGSTSVPELAAKPIIDIAVGVRRLEESSETIAALRTLGYTFEEPVEDEDELYLYKGAPHTHHVHIVEHGGAAWARYLSFRDRLRSDRALAERYVDLKRDLARRHWNDADRHAYAHAKGAFIEEAGAGG